MIKTDLNPKNAVVAPPHTVLAFIPTRKNRLKMGILECRFAVFSAIKIGNPAFVHEVEGRISGAAFDQTSRVEIGTPTFWLVKTSIFWLRRENRTRNDQPIGEV